MDFQLLSSETGQELTDGQVAIATGLRLFTPKRGSAMVEQTLYREELYDYLDEFGKSLGERSKSIVIIWFDSCKSLHGLTSKNIYLVLEGVRDQSVEIQGSGLKIIIFKSSQRAHLVRVTMTPFTKQEED